MFNMQKAPAKAWPGEKQGRWLLWTKFRGCKEALTSFRDHQQSKYHLAAL